MRNDRYGSRPILLDLELRALDDVMMGRPDEMALRAEGFGRELRPQCVGIYALMRRGRVVYVGQSKNVWRRIGEHFKTRRKSRQGLDTRLGWGWADVKVFEFDDVLVRWCLLGELDMLEVDIVSRYRPEYNVDIRPVRRPEDFLDAATLAGLFEPRPTPGGFRRRV